MFDTDPKTPTNPDEFGLKITSTPLQGTTWSVPEYELLVSSGVSRINLTTAKGTYAASKFPANSQNIPFVRNKAGNDLIFVNKGTGNIDHNKPVYQLTFRTKVY